MAYLVSCQFVLSHSPFPEAEGGFLIEGAAGGLEGPAGLPAVVRLVRDQVAKKRDCVGLESLDLTPGGQCLAEQGLDCMAGGFERLLSSRLSPSVLVSSLVRPSRRAGFADFSHNKRTLCMCANRSWTVRLLVGSDEPRASSGIASRR